MELQKQPTTVSITFSPKDYWLRLTAGYPAMTKDDADFYGEYCLTHRIDMSYAGKADQEGGIALFVSDKQAQIFREAGFAELI